MKKKIEQGVERMEKLFRFSVAVFVLVLVHVTSLKNKKGVQKQTLFFFVLVFFVTPSFRALFVTLLSAHNDMRTQVRAEISEFKRK